MSLRDKNRVIRPDDRAWVKQIIQAGWTVEIGQWRAQILMRQIVVIADEVPAKSVIESQCRFDVVSVVRKEPPRPLQFVQIDRRTRYICVSTGCWIKRKTAADGPHTGDSADQRRIERFCLASIIRIGI